MQLVFLSETIRRTSRLAIPHVFARRFVPLLMLALVGCGRSTPAPPPPETVRVHVMTPIKRKLTDHREFNGWLEADKMVEVRSRVRGHIRKVHFTDGQLVSKGDVLFELDPRPFELEVERARDRLRIFEAQKIAAEKELARLQALLKRGGASLQQVEKAEADVASLEAQISGTKNEIKRAQLDVEYAKITADISGRVSRALLTEGNLVNAGGSDPILTTIVSVDPIRIYFNIDERSLHQYARHRGVQGKTLTQLLANLKEVRAKFTFALDGETEFKHEGTLAFGDNRVDPSTGTLQVYGTAPNADGRYLAGSRVRVRLPISKEYEARLVPETAILADQDKRYLLIADAEDLARRRNVVLGKLTDDSYRAIEPAEPLPDGEQVATWRVIIDNLQRVRLNQTVQVDSQ